METIWIGVVLAVVALLAIFIATRPSPFRIERSRVIEAPPARVFPLVNDFHTWTRWSPWEQVDPNLQRTYEGAPAGVGAIYSWKGKPKVGEGRMTLAQSEPPTRIVSSWPRRSHWS